MRPDPPLNGYSMDFEQADSQLGEEQGQEHVPLSTRKKGILALYDCLAGQRDRWIMRNRYYYDEDYRYMRFLVPEGKRVLEIGCGTGELLAALKPVRGVGVDLSPKMVEHATKKYGNMEFHAGDIEDPDLVKRLQGSFDAIVLSDLIVFLEDCEGTLANLHSLCTPDTRIVISQFSRSWAPILAVLERVGLKMPQPEQNWLGMQDIEHLLALADWELGVNPNSS
jgi:2-polyprenyl-3-methyl-5-hydroxy-6-metoxy-1,4-benzoquinol methylase